MPETGKEAEGLWKVRFHGLLHAYACSTLKETDECGGCRSLHCRAMCRGLEELQVEREEVTESNFKGDINNVDNLDRIFG
jgi:hypothetical protein